MALLSLTSALDGGGWLTPRPGCFTPGKETRYPLYRRLGGPQGRSRGVWKISPLPGFDPRIVRPEQSRYTELGKYGHNKFVRAVSKVRLPAGRLPRNSRLVGNFLQRTPMQNFVEIRRTVQTPKLDRGQPAGRGYHKSN
jgi:hypothetical protein